MSAVYTLGHSRHPIARFIALLRGSGVALVIDTRGRPFSRFNPQFNGDRGSPAAPGRLRTALADAGIAYRWMGETLSGRPAERAFYDAAGEVDWAKLASWPALGAALDDVAALSARTPLALVCAEEDPRFCHRRFLLTPPLLARGCEVRHVRGDGRIEAELAAGSRERQADLFG